MRRKIRCESPCGESEMPRMEHFRAAAAQAAWPLDTCPAAIPLTLLHWLAKPTPWDGLGHAILKEISAHVPIPGYSIW